MNTIGDRVRAALQGAGMQQKTLAARVSMTPDALSRALRGERGFAAVELAEIARTLHANLHELITGEPDPSQLTFSARHTYDHNTGDRRVDGAEGDRSILESIRLAYEQAGDVEPSRPVLSDAANISESLGESFVRDFIDRLAGIDIDVVRVEELSTAYAFTIEGRSVIAIKSTGNWFFENWSLAHELGHLALGHRGVMPGEAGHDMDEAAANAFAAELLLPRVSMEAAPWSSMTLADLAVFVWDRGVSTEAVRRRLGALGITPPMPVQEALQMKTQRLLRHHWNGSGFGDPITERMTAAARRTFPSWLKAAHLEQVAAGAINKGTLAWMLEVDEESLEVEEPTRMNFVSAYDLADMLG